MTRASEHRPAGASFTVDIPQWATEEWDEVASFDTRAEALRFAQERFGADDKGRICLVSKVGALDDDPLHGERDDLPDDVRVLLEDEGVSS